MNSDMIKCPNCGGLNIAGVQVCGACGFSLFNTVNQQIQQNQNNVSQANFQDQPIQNAQVNNAPINNGYVQVQPTQLNQNNDSNQSIQNNQVNNAPLNNDFVQGQSTQLDHNNNQINLTQVVNDEAFINAYIGKNAESIRNEKFSVAAFIFGGLYFWHRKFYKLLLFWILYLAAVWIVKLIVAFMIVFINSGDSKEWITNIFSIIFKVLPLLANLFAGYKFNGFYLKHVEKKVNMIKNNNQDKSPQELLELCSKKGGTTKAPIILVIVSPILYLLFVVFTALIITSSFSNHRIGAFADDAHKIVDVVRTDVVTKGLNDSRIEYSMAEINELMEVELGKSPFGNEYIDAKVVVTNDSISNTTSYKVCLIDSKRNGFNYVDEDDIKSSNVLKGKAPSTC